MLYLAMDLETGGVENDKSLLTAYLEVLDENFKKIVSLSLAVKPNDDTYKVTAEALKINKINLVEHNTVAITEGAAGTALYDFLKLASSEGKNKLVPLGHNVAFDIGFLQAQLMTKKTWNQFVSYRVRDTGTLGGAMLDAGLLPPTLTGGLRGYATHFGIADNAAHTAEGDVAVTVAVYRAMLAIMGGL